MTAQRRHELADRRKKVSALYLRRISQVEIAEQLGVSKYAVCRDIKILEKEWRSEYVASINAIHNRELAELDQMERDMAMLYYHNHDPAIIDRRLRVKDHRAKLLGLYSAVKTELTGDGGGPQETVVRIIYEDDVCQPSTTSGSNGHTQHNGASLQARLNGR